MQTETEKHYGTEWGWNSPNNRESQSYDLPTPTGVQTIVGWRIGHGSSQKPTHRCNTAVTTSKLSCGACRWTELSIFILTDECSRKYAGARYAVHTHGRSILENESSRCRLTTTHIPYVVVEALVVRTTYNQHNPLQSQATVFLPRAAALALAEAAYYDSDIEHAYVNRAIP